MKTCSTCGQDNPDAARFCLACGSPLVAPEPVVEERKVITVLFTDIVGSTAKAEQMDPEDVRARLAPYYVRLRTELERFGGTVEKFIGDAVVALFGAPVAHEDDPERAVKAALAIREAIDELNAADEWLDLRVRIGVNTGEALVVVGARASEGEGLAAGDVMNTAARLQSAAPVNGILVGALTHEATRDAIEYRTSEPIAAKGKSEPVAVWEAVRALDGAGRRRPRKRALIGRGPEMDALEELWQAVLRERRPALATLLGPAGIGKSRLLIELAEHVASLVARETKFANSFDPVPSDHLQPAAPDCGISSRGGADPGGSHCGTSFSFCCSCAPARSATRWPPRRSSRPGRRRRPRRTRPRPAVPARRTSSG